MNSADLNKTLGRLLLSVGLGRSFGREQYKAAFNTYKIIEKNTFLARPCPPILSCKPHKPADQIGGRFKMATLLFTQEGGRSLAVRKRSLRILQLSTMGIFKLR